MNPLEQFGLIVTGHQPDDLNLIWNSWMRCSHDSDEGRRYRKNEFMDRQKAEIDHLFTLPETYILVLRSDEYPIVIDGWLCATGDHLNFQFLKSSRRRMGLGSALLEKAGELKTYGFIRRPWSDMYERRGMTFKGTST